MGGGSINNYGTQIIDPLAKVAQDSFKNAQPAKRNVFISCDHPDISEVNLLRGNARNEDTDLEF
jgi:hypothetical protein